MLYKNWLTIGIIVLTTGIFANNNEMSGKSFIEYIPGVRKLIERRTTEKIQRITDDISTKGLYTQSESELRNFTPIHRLILQYNSQKSGTPESVYNNLWIAYSCVNLIAETVPTLPFGLFKFDSDSRVENNPIDKMLKGKVTDTMTGKDFLSYMAMGLCIRGNAYGYVTKIPGSKVLSIMPILPQYIRPVTSEKNRDKVAYYKFTQYGSSDIPVEDIIHAKLLSSTSTVEGYSPLSAGGALTEFADEQATFKLSAYQNQVKPAGVLETDMPLDSKQRNELKEWLDKMRGSDNAGREMMLTHGMKWKPISYSPQDLELLASEKLNWSMICTLYRIPVELFGNLANQKNYANMREATKHLYLFALIPMAEKIFSAISNYFFPNMDYEWKVLDDQIPALRPTAEELKEEYWLTPLQKLMKRGGEAPKEKEKLDLLDEYYFPGSWQRAKDMDSESILENPETL